MVSLCLNIRNEVRTDIKINNQNILPSFLDLPNLSSSIYSTELCSRLRAFLVACPPTGPSSPVAELIVATADLQKDFSAWSIRRSTEARMLHMQAQIDSLLNSGPSHIPPCPGDARRSQPSRRRRSQDNTVHALVDEDSGEESDHVSNTQR